MRIKTTPCSLYPLPPPPPPPGKRENYIKMWKSSISFISKRIFPMSICNKNTRFGLPRLNHICMFIRSECLYGYLVYCSVLLDFIIVQPLNVYKHIHTLSRTRRQTHTHYHTAHTLWTILYSLTKLKGEVSPNNNVDWVSRKQFYRPNSKSLNRFG